VVVPVGATALHVRTAKTGISGADRGYYDRDDDGRNGPMSSSPTAGAGEDDIARGAGNNTDQHVTGPEETGTFLTDKAPTADTPAHGSSDAGVNATGANRTDFAAGDRPDGD
jgi:hypothetical protein